MAIANHQESLPVNRDKLFAAIIRYEDYPQFVEGCSRVAVERKGPGKARVTYFVNIIKEVSYVLDHVEDAAAGTVSWSLVSSDVMKKNQGKWTLRTDGDARTHVNYDVDVEFKVWVPGPILNRLVKGSLPAMIENFKARALKG